MEKKKCTKCGKHKAHNEFWWQKEYLTKRGYITKRRLKSACIACSRVDQNNRNKRIGIDARSTGRKRFEFYLYGKNLSLLQRYGITLEQYRQMLKKQNNKCAICKKQFPDTTTYDGWKIRRGKEDTLFVDHNHETGEIRELLCSYDNFAYGCIGEDTQRIKNLLAYHRKHIRSTQSGA